MSVDDVSSKNLNGKPKTSKLRMTMRIAFGFVKYAWFVTAVVFFLSQSRRSTDPLIAWITDVVEPLGLVVVCVIAIDSWSLSKHCEKGYY